MRKSVDFAARWGLGPLVYGVQMRVSDPPVSAVSRWGADRLTGRQWGFVAATAGAVAFSGKAIVAKLMYRLGADAVSTVGLRMAYALPLFALLAWWTSRSEEARQAPLTREDAWWVAGLGFFGYYLASTLDFLGLQYISAGLERAILYLNPTLVLLMSALWLGHRLRWQALVAMAVAYGGVCIVFFHDLAQLTHVGQSPASGESGMATMSWRDVWLGGSLVFGSALSYALYLMGSGRLVQRLGSLRLVSHASCVACMLCMLQWAVVHTATEGRVGALVHLPWQAHALSMFNAVVCTLLPIWWVMQGVRLLGASMASQVGMIGPLSTLYMASVWLQEPITPELLGGTVAILAGVVLLARVKD